MRSRVRYSIIYSRETYKHIKVIGRKYHRLIQKTIEEQLTITPEQKTRNRKPLEEFPGPFGSTWELRFGPGNRFRVYYEVVPDSKTVWILAIGVKKRNRLLIDGEEFEL
jgi:mRNA-degrading endonuclease RelE of RelBE toxin-antitoxin system